MRVSVSPLGPETSREYSQYGEAGVSFSTVFLLVNAAGPSSGNCCFHESRWPLGEQAAALAFPSVPAGLLMVVAALLVRCIQWWVRAVVPSVVWVAALTVQHAVWSP